jgi:hypothetical protein
MGRQDCNDPAPAHRKQRGWDWKQSLQAQIEDEVLLDTAPISTLAPLTVTSRPALRMPSAGTAGAIALSHPDPGGLERPKDAPIAAFQRSLGHAKSSAFRKVPLTGLRCSCLARPAQHR